MRVIGITGGVGSGKSGILAVLREEFGAKLLIADEMAHEAMEPGRESYRRITEALGTDFLAPDGTIDRKRLAELIFKDKEALETMNSIVHPAVWDAIAAEIDGAKEGLVAVEAALFDEEHNQMFDEVWYVFTSEENRIRRLREGRGYSREKCLSIMKNQKPEEAFRAMADRVIDNNGSLEDARRQIENILKEDTRA